MGGLWASRGPEASPFTDYDADLAQVIVGLVAAGLAQAAAWQAMRQLAATDPLTGLANRRALDEHLRRLLTQTAARGQTLTVAVGDINGLKAVNDTAGHAAGDDIILRVAAAAQGAIAAIPDALAARLGGYEFASSCPPITSAQDPASYGWVSDSRRPRQRRRWARSQSLQVPREREVR